MTISMERARECVGRPVLAELDDGETKEGVIQYVGRSYIKVLIEGQEDGWVMSEDKLTWKPLLPNDTRYGVANWEDDTSSDGHWEVIEYGDQTMIVSFSEEAYADDWRHHFLISDPCKAIYQGHPEANKWIGAEIQELRGWADA